MSERRDYVALDWVAGEIEETLKQASQALEAYIANRDDTTKLRFCLTHIHQVHGTLQMVEFFGAALVAKEMEQLVDALSKGEVHDSHIDDALAVLKSGIEKLPLYLERVKESKHGLPSTLLPVLNDLRAVRGDSLLSETVLFSPDMSAAAARGATQELALKGSELIEVAHKLRQMFQISLLGVIRGRDVRKNLNYLAKVCARLSRMTAGRPSQALWRASIAILEGLLNGSIDTSVAVKILLRQVDQQIKRIISSGESVFEEASPEDLLKNLLFYVARSKASSKFIQEIKE
jgi:chemosensory pili system protein ChpA (sensor histidine kinase/response regulator)